MSQNIDQIQATDTTRGKAAVKNTIRERVERRRQRESLETEAHVRTLLEDAKAAIIGSEDLDRPVANLLEELHYYLWFDPDRSGLRLDPAAPQDSVRQFHHIQRLLYHGRRPEAEEWLAVLAEIAKALGYMAAVSDTSKYAPITLEPLDVTGASSSVETPTPVGRIRVPKDSTTPLDNRAAEIPHTSCEHILTVALPRQGKDSTNASICGNLKDEHGYKWVSVLDDGRNELPMIAVPNDEAPIRENLDRLGQTPRGYNCEVFVPVMPGLPDRLPANHIPFKIGLESLTPSLILRLAGLTSINADTQRRVSRALKETLAGTGEVSDLVDRLQEYAEELQHTITVSQLDDDQDPDAEDIEEISYQMDEDTALRDAAHTLAQLAGDGLIGDRGDDANLDMEGILRRQDAAAVLSCNFLEDGDEALKYTIMDLWMQLVWRARDANSRLPRVVLEVRELKNLAPSQPGNLDYASERRATRQTLYKITSQGGSRRILLAGSTQKINDVARPIRVNMETKLLLKNGEGGIDVLQESHNLSQRQVEQILEFDKGEGMLVEPGDHHWPVEWRGARCGLGMGDRNWLDRYGIASGARVRESTRDRWGDRFGDEPWWVEVNDMDVRDGDEAPSVGKYYAEWYLLASDFPDDVERADVDADLVEAILQERREYPINCDLSLRDVDRLEVDRTETLQGVDEARQQRLEERFEEYDVPDLLQPWVEKSASKRENMLRVLKTVEEQTITQYSDVENHVPVSASTVGNYATDNNELGAAIVFDEDRNEYAVTPIGERALDIPWDEVLPE